MLTIPGLQNAEALVNSAWNLGLKPPPMQTLDVWADQKFVLGAKEPEPGPWKTSRTPYLREPMQCLSPLSPIKDLACMKGSQLGWTKMLLAWVLFIVDQAHAETLIVLPNEKATKTWIKRQLKPTLTDNPNLARSIRSSKERDSGNTMYCMEFAGGYALNAAWSSSSAGLKSIPAPNVLGDEIDSWVLDCENEGDPVFLAGQRSTNFHQRKYPKISTPSESGDSRISKLFLEGDQRRYFVPCPYCRHYQVLQLANFHYAPANAEKKDDIESAWFVCVGCKEPIGEVVKAEWYDPEKPEGVWIPTRDRDTLYATGFAAKKLPELLAEKEAHFTEFASFHIPQFYAPLGWTGSSWFAIAQKWLAAKTNSQLEKAFTTHVLGEPIRVKGEMPDYRNIQDRAEDMDFESPQDGVLIAVKIPAEGLVLTVAADVQPDWIEGEIRAWGPRRESWSVGHFQLYGNTREEQVWQELSDVIIDRTYRHELGGELAIQLIGIDCGFQPDQVYRLCRRYPKPIYSNNMAVVSNVRTVIPLRGGHRKDKLLEKWSTVDQARQRQGLRIVTYSSHLGKLTVYDRLQLKRGDAGTPPPSGYIHLPRCYDRHVFQSVTAERLVMKASGELDWIKEYQRNEVLDCFGYQEGNAEFLGLETWSDERWAERRRTLTKTAATFNRTPEAQSEAEETGVILNYSDDPFLR